MFNFIWFNMSFQSAGWCSVWYCMSRMLSLRKGICGSPVGPMSEGKFQNFQEKLTKRMLLWCSPPQGGKEVLIKSVAQWIPTSIMSVFKLPLGWYDDLDQMNRNYLWGSKKCKRKAHWKSWGHLLKPKSRGGIGFRDLRLFNQALLARQAWRLLMFPGSLCARALHAKYYPNGNFEDTVFAGNPSSLWLGISRGLDLLKKGLIWRIRNG